MKGCKVTNPDIALIIHSHDLSNLHHVIMPYLENIGRPFDVYLNFSEIVGSKGEEIKKYKKELIQNNPHISFFFTTSDNRGTDNGGFVASTIKAKESGMKGKYKYVCKLHTKSLGEKVLPLGVTKTQWTYGLLNGLLGSQNRVSEIVSGFDAWPSIGLVSIKRFYSDCFGIESNMENYTFFTKKLNLNPNSCFPQNPNFVAGTMFWMKGEVWDFFMDQDLTLGEFEIGFSSDGLRSHAMERIYEAVSNHLGYGIYLL
tara:strand:+ start:6067 stop:6837 length:771 start_codon:yes stop_codon:yes gene_type:complete